MSFQTTLITALALTALTASAKAFAEPLPALYWELNYGQIQTDSPNLNLDIVSATLGANLTQHLAIEGFIGTGIGTETFNREPSTIEAQVNHIYGFSLKPNYALNDKITLFGKLGYRWSQEELKETNGAAQATFDSKGWLAGIGGEYKVFDHFYVNSAYSILETEDGDNANLLNIGIGQQF
ncbi:hypothetical protein THMIRHAS_02850 [Thiosulfatimonas sediminis]|uniref:Outer membrane protein beta-barrel domain-containing protein n=1 Tax=Thiosulfatimonas sediminis TaxID=2675054 RepID=A0A6F8PS03_9GAMM|nr:outer membrane beta-barrel protein [Thiosulfatimonas sediminis]BBP44912.1 hypothetical protein THMIRHAS_02850 [Thiosulfatimonas sediminis]